MIRYLKELSLYKKVLLVLCLGFELVAILLSFKVIYGDYYSTVLGVPWALVYDPGGWYIPSGAYFFQTRTTIFWGHPGLLLQLIIGLVIESSYVISGMWQRVPYPDFFIKNYRQFTIVVSIIVSLFHIPLFYLIYQLAKSFFEEQVYPVISVLAFGTTITVLLFINRVSPDVICTFLIVLSICALLQAINRYEAGKKSTPSIILASFAITTAVFSKAVYGLPAYVAVLVFLVFYKFPAVRKDPSFRIRLFIWFISVSLVSALLWSIKMDYGLFFDYWFRISQKYSDTLLDKIKAVMLENPNISSAVLVSEWLYLIMVVIGFKNMLINRAARQKPETILLTLVFLFSLPMAVTKKIVPHYMYVPFAIGAIPFSFQLKRLFDTYLSGAISEQRRFMAGMVIIIFMHTMAFFTASTQFMQSITTSQQTYKPLYAALREVGYNEKIAMNGELEIVRKNFIILPNDTPKPIREALKDFFVYAKSMDDIQPDSGVKYFVDISESSTEVYQLR